MLKPLPMFGSMLAMGLLAAAASAAPPVAPPPAPPTATSAAAAAELPAGAGRDTVMRVCSACHSPNVVAQQRLTPEGWHELVQTMANNGAVATDAELAEITGYLTRSFPATGTAPSPKP